MINKMCGSMTSDSFRKVVKGAVCAISALILSFSLYSCNDKEFRMGTDIVDGDKVGTGETTFPVKAWTVRDFTRDTLSGRAYLGKIFNPQSAGSGIRQYFFNIVGNYSVPDMYDIEAGFATRLNISNNIPVFGDMVVDSVLFTIAYTPVAELSASSTEGYVGFETNSQTYTGVFDPFTYVIYGNYLSNNIALEIYRLGEKFPDQYSTISGTSIQKENHIPLTKKWATAEMIHEELFQPVFDTIKSTTDITDSTYTYDDDGKVIDTTYIYADSIYPRLQFKMDKDYWQNVIDHFKGYIITQDAFNDYFNGLYFRVKKGFKSPLLMFDLFQEASGSNGRGSNITIYYHSSNISGGTVSFNFLNSLSNMPFSANSIQTTFSPRLEAMMENPDTVRGEKSLYIIPYGGTEVVVDVISEENINYIRDKGWIINDAYIEFTNKGYNESARNFPVVELWMYKYPYGDQFVYYNSSLGYPLEKVDFYIPDQATFTYNEASDTWQYTPRYNYGLNGIINENSASAKFSYPGKYRMRVTRTLIDMVYGDAKNVKLGLRLPFGVTQNAPFMSVLNGEDLKLVVKYTEKNEGE